MSKQNNLVQEAQQQALNTVRAFSDLKNVLDAMASFGNRATHQHVGKDDFFNGLSLIRNAIAKEHDHALANLFLLTGVGGPEALNYSQEQFKKWFGNERHHVMSFLEEFGTLPSFYRADTEQQFRKDIKTEIEKINNEEKSQ